MIPMSRESRVGIRDPGRRYRKRGGVKRSPLPDFYIGAHAASAGYAVLTRDPGRYRDYFESVPVIAPE